ncbi:ImmA/IrrE family metallo-endopeptidase [uncultured Selenomonas sp.]|uniref:ImmA/IrrE family metallo-endopeptidase n=1 Tax=uncultured Selenomonas sp. TaxID=159275 RepID=UPI0028E4A5C8|nr:ImmA/IrrE family metallo-endopeptidase [uncultured Selenomonas sp.]
MTYNPHSRFERQANTFAVELLLPDDLLREYPDCSIYQLARSAGVPENFVELKRAQTFLQKAAIKEGLQTWI